ncbi:MAG: peptide-methionine (S)-S-oxide reductase MsrA [Candidatus Bathyarchaeota archaeon]
MSNKQQKPTKTDKLEVATLGGGCFWCIEAAFDQIKGVVKVESGYSGGKTSAPSYEQVCTGTTGHAEVVQVTFDSAVLSFREILEIFFTAHDPTTLNQQGADIGTQYRSVIFYHSEKQKETIKKVIQEFETKKGWNRPIVTQVEPFKKFYKAEDYHDKYFARHPQAGYCKVVIAPKIAKLRKKYQKMVKINSN